MEVQLNAFITKDIPLYENNNNKLITLPSKLLDPPTLNQTAIEIDATNKDSCIKIRVNANNSIIHINQDESTSTQEDEASRFKLKTKALYGEIKATIEETIPQENEFLEPTFKIKNGLGKTKLVKHNGIVLDLLTIPPDLSFVTKANRDIPDDKSFVTSDTNSFATSNSKHLRRSR